MSNPADLVGGGSRFPFPSFLPFFFACCLRSTCPAHPPPGTAVPHPLSGGLRFARDILLWEEWLREVRNYAGPAGGRVGVGGRVAGWLAGHKGGAAWWGSRAVLLCCSPQSNAGHPPRGRASSDLQLLAPPPPPLKACNSPLPPVPSPPPLPHAVRLWCPGSGDWALQTPQQICAVGAAAGGDTSDSGKATSPGKAGS